MSEALPVNTGTARGEWHRVHPLSMAVQMARTLASAVIPAVLVIYGSASNGPASAGLSWATPYLVPILVLIIAINLFGAWLGWVRLRYRVGENDVRMEQGILSRSARSVPYERIQDVSLEQKLVPRLLGLVEVKFETGAGGKEELRLAYVTEEQGETLRETVRALVEEENAEPAPLDATDRAAEPASVASERGELLFAMPPGRLFLYGLFNFSLVVFAVLIGTLQQFEAFLPFDVWGTIASIASNETLTSAEEAFSSYSFAARVAAILYALVSVIAIGMVSGVVRTFIQDWAFRLERTPKGFRRRRGLLTKTDVVMPIHRVQALIVKTGIIRRRFGWYGLSVISLAQDAKNANHEVAPFARMEEIAPIAREAGFALPGEAVDWHRPSPDYRFDKALLSAGTCFAAALGFLLAKATLPPEAQGLGIGAAIMVVFGLAFAAQQLFLWRFQRHGVDERFVYTRRNWLAPRTEIASRVKLQSVEVSQGPLSRWRGYASLKFGLAGGTFEIPGLPLEEAYAIRAKVLESIAAVDFAKLPR
ncbi:PH domain-containing protein [Aurantiacibacter poecillastricola]|uniref:PH domain-containing protein n=1 Tax=Aurantiacibacter poecillastricola TaxID=3064385 RepID=UPI00273E10B0|nr:PH domain-containing protein [Aurantiacibacter sp. 219JJ12-13]MDP5260421.1 PH domain-containing protein [Aurantiacibacter sp. 219JJ12-13]